MNIVSKTFFNMKGRERLLLIAFITVVLLWWLSSLIKTGGQQWSAYSSSRRYFNTQTSAIERASFVESQLKQALSRLDSNRTYSDTQLFGKLDNIARSFDLDFDVSQPTSENSGIYATHTIRVRIDDSNLEQLVRFNQGVQAEAPYIAIAEFKLSANRRDRSKIDATFDIASFELLENLSQ
jgi:hypothetical protein|tara:strand:- start:1190 stop:1732 length:543 start_codon:yes stop_codon:yes gene_type:complete